MQRHGRLCKQVKLRALPACASEPAMPPVSYVVRSVLFVDCAGGRQPQMCTVQVFEEDTAATVKAKVAAAFADQVCTAGHAQQSC